MKESTKTILISATVALSLFFFYNFLKDYWMAKGEEKTKNYYNEKLTEYTTDTQRGYAEKDRLIENAVKEKLDDRAIHHGEINELKNNHLKYKEKIQLDFQEINKKIFTIAAQNDNLKTDVLNLRAVLLSFSLANKQLTLALNELEMMMFNKYNTAMNVFTKAIDERYINFLNNINRIKKSKKSWRMK